MGSQTKTRTYRTITLTGRAPVRIAEDQWPIIASAKRFDGQVECQANRTWHLTVRQHADGRAIVYGVYDSCYPGEGARAGQIIANSVKIPTVIYEVAEACGCTQIADDCIADLPAVDLK